jgi:hypothetical protein
MSVTTNLSDPDVLTETSDPSLTNLFGNVNQIKGSKKDDVLRGTQGDDQLWGYQGNDLIYVGKGADTLVGGQGKDTFVIGMKTGSTTLADADWIADFRQGQDHIQLLESLSFDDLKIVQGQGTYAKHTLIQDQNTGQYLAILKNIKSHTLKPTDFIENPHPPHNKPPVAENDTLSDSVLLSSRLEIPVADLLANDSDANGDSLTITAVASEDGTVFLKDRLITFQAHPNFAGPASFEYTVSDGKGGTDTATVSFNVISEVALETLTTPTEQPIGVNGYGIYTDFPHTADQGDWQISTAGDVNGDGLDDVVLGTPWSDIYDLGGGRVIYGKSNETPLSITTADGFSFGGRFGDWGSAFGKFVGNSGDFNGDGYADIVAGGVTTPMFPGVPGWIDIIFGAPQGKGDQIEVNNVFPGDNTGFSVDGGGDINGDGLDDVVSLGSGGSYTPLGINGNAYVIFGTQNLEPIPLRDIDAGQGGFFIHDIYPYSVMSVAGDVNGDGLEDVIVNDLRGPSVTSYVVFGKRNSQSVDVSTLEQTHAGFAITLNSWIQEVSSAGDVNGDGLEDVILGAHKTAYVVFGKTDSQPIDLNALGNHGFKITSDLSVSFHDFVSSAGDFNADGLDDVMVGTLEKTYLIFGKSDTDDVNLNEVAKGNGGFALNGAGNVVSDAGDVNGDGYADVILGTPGKWYNPDNLDFVGAYVVFGGDVTTSVTQQGTKGKDRLTGTFNADVMIGGQGDDLLIGNGGADILYGGAGNDILAISDANFKRIDGGSGIDTLRLDASNLTLDLTQIADSKMQSLEQIDLRGAGQQTLSFNLTDFLNLVGNNPTQPGTLTILGNGHDTVNANLLGGAPIFVDQGIQGQFRRFSNGYATLRVSKGVALNITLDTPPIAGDDTIEGTVLLGSPVEVSATTLLANDSDADGDSLTITAVASEDGKVSLKDGIITFQAQPGLTGPVSFDYTVDDGHGGTDIGTVNLNIVSELELEAIATQTNLPIGADGFVIYGNTNATHHIVSDAGDVNGDGLDDLIIGIPYGSSNPQSYVVFGQAENTAINLSEIESGIGGFVINGAGFSVSGAGDVNNDGFSDLIASNGESYVVFGKANTNPVDVTDLATGMEGFVINRTATNEGNGFSVSDAGDVNGDGLADVIIGDPWASVNGNTSAGKSFVVFGQTDDSTINLENVTNGIGGFVINGRNSGDQSGYAVSDAGDVNGDGLADVVVGSYGAGNGEAYVIFGKTDGVEINLDDIAVGNGGFAITGTPTHSLSGKSVSGGGDINGDGLSDVIVSASYSDGYTGHAYIIFGQATATSVNLDEIAVGNGGFIINGIAAYDGLGVSVSNADDLNGDGFDDLLIGAKYGTPDGKTWAGKTYVVFGQPDIAEVNIDQIEAGQGGFVLNGIDNYDAAGIDVSGAGDVNGDGFSDLLVGTRNAQSGSGAGTGDSYTIFGNDFSASVTHQGTAGDDTLTGRLAYDPFIGHAMTDVMIGGQGDDQLIGQGGADVLYGGADDDLIAIGSFSYSTPLFKRIEGGTGIDTIRLDSYANLDLTSIYDPLIQGIEQIDLNQGSNNILTLNFSDLLNLSETSNTLTVLGGTTDQIHANLSGAGFVDFGVTDGFREYSNGIATLWVAEVISQTVNL